ncbi:hypothetical protein DTO027B5_3474 [Paecilomyces variotii]|nr:hypothetical protein DTO032I3_5401 [Paecilomyces variotii]KAJ9276699.1 hypothetical protein DTO021D3_6459 [Paecilomyces variotii]KAJ9321531.1 hypothetical protein DTO027B3_7431 [Paecilomyces variotii]KAJ9334677.1 hypothetical protein DTO027B5_3474 [Paecilomyces variotii]KAJ9341607.1 hypothetical protein DTO027B6_5820 [Paecilomyces variotii]
MNDPIQEPVDLAQETPPTDVFRPPSIDRSRLLSGESYANYTECPPAITLDSAVPGSAETSEPTPCVLGVDEAGRGPVLGPMVYSAFYLPRDLHHSLLAKDHAFNDSKVLTPGVRSNLMRLLCTPGHPLFQSCGWAVKVLSAQDISSGMMRPGAGVYNLNAQAMDATIEIIRGIVEERKVDVKEVYIDTIGNPATYQAKLERIFPTLKITVAKKADSLYPCVSAASVVAKVTRDAALDLCYEELMDLRRNAGGDADALESAAESWGSGYPSDSKCVNWLKRDMDPIFGWGTECRFSWGTVKDLLEVKGPTRVDWPVDEAEAQISEYFLNSSSGQKGKADELSSWYGQKAGMIF